MNEFEFHRPRTIAEAVRLLREAGDARLLAGGQSLLAAMKLNLASAEWLIDLSQIGELQGIAADSAGLRIGAMTSHATVAASSVVRQSIPALAALA